MTVLHVAAKESTELTSTQEKESVLGPCQYYKFRVFTATYPPQTVFEVLCNLWDDADKILNTLSYRTTQFTEGDCKLAMDCLTSLLTFFRHWCTITDRLATSQYFDDVFPGREEGEDAAKQLLQAVTELSQSRTPESVQKLVAAAESCRSSTLSALYNESTGLGGVTIFPFVFATNLVHLDGGHGFVVLFCQKFEPRLLKRVKFGSKVLFPTDCVLRRWYKYYSFERAHLRERVHKFAR